MCMYVYVGVKKNGRGVYVEHRHCLIVDRECAGKKERERERDIPTYSN